MKILLDTNFILTAAKLKIDFQSLGDVKFDEVLEYMVPIEVEEELKELSKGDSGDAEAARLGLKIIENFDKVPLGVDVVDDGIVSYAKNDSGVVVATMDKNLKKRFDNKVLTIRGKGSLEIV